MLDQQDLQAIASLLAGSEDRMMKHIAASEERMIKRMDQSIAASEERMIKRMEHMIHESENNLLDEISRTYNFLDAKIEKLQKNVEEITQYYRIKKLEDDNTAILLELTREMNKQIENMNKRIENLEKKIA